MQVNGPVVIQQQLPQFPPQPLPVPQQQPQIQQQPEVQDGLPIDPAGFVGMDVDPDNGVDFDNDPPFSPEGSPAAAHVSDDDFEEYDPHYTPEGSPIAAPVNDNDFEENDPHYTPEGSPRAATPPVSPTVTIRAASPTPAPPVDPHTPTVAFQGSAAVQTQATVDGPSPAMVAFQNSLRYPESRLPWNGWNGRKNNDLYEPVFTDRWWAQLTTKGKLRS